MSEYNRKEKHPVSNVIWVESNLVQANDYNPTWRRLCKVLLRNDYWCKGLGQVQPKSEAYEKFKELKKRKKEISNLRKEYINVKPTT